MAKKIEKEDKKPEITLEQKVENLAKALEILTRRFENMKEAILKSRTVYGV